MSTKGLEEPFMDEIRRLGVEIGLTAEDVKRDLDYASGVIYNLIYMINHKYDGPLIDSSAYADTLFLKSIFEARRRYCRSFLMESNDGA